MEERLFNNIKDRFSESGDDLGWNAPPDDLFSKAMDRKENKEKRKRYFFLIIPFSLLMVASVAFFFLVPSDKQNQISEVKVKSQNPESPSLIIDNRKSVQAETVLINTQESESQLKIEKEQRSDSDVFNSTVQNKTIVFNREVVVEQVESIQKVVLNEEPFSLLNRFPLLNNKRNSISYISPLVKMNEVSFGLIQEESKIEANRKIGSIYFLSGVNSSKLCMSGDISQEVELKGYDSYYEGLDLELGIEFLPQNNLKPYFLLSYRRLNNSSFYSSPKDLNSGAFVHNQDGTLDYSFREMMTPMGMVDPVMEASMSHPNGSDSHVYQYADISQRVDIAQVGVGLKYSFWELNRFTASVSTGFSLNNFIKKNTQANLYLMDSSDNMMKESQFQGSDMDGVNNFFYTHTVSLHAGYRLNNKFDLAFRFNRTGNIGSLLSYKNLNTKLNSYSTHFGLSMRF